jgi:hypothetical protein
MAAAPLAGSAAAAEDMAVAARLAGSAAAAAAVAGNPAEVAG